MLAVLLVVHTPSLGLLRVPSLGLLLAQLRPLMVLVLVAVAVAVAEVVAVEVVVVVVVVAAVLVVWAILLVRFPFLGAPVSHWRVPVPVHLRQP